jgi:hypothetical protein
LRRPQATQAPRFALRQRRVLLPYRSSHTGSRFAAYDTRLCPAADIPGPAGLDHHRNPVATSSPPGSEPGHVLVDTQMEITMTTDTEALVRRAYHFAEGAVLDVRGSPACSPRTVYSPASAVCLARRATGVSIWAMWSSLWASSCPTFTGNCTGSTCSGMSSRSSCRSGGLPRAVRDARRGDRTDGGQARHPDRRLLVRARRKSQEFNCHIGGGHHVRAAGRTAGLHLRSRRVRAPTITPTSPEGNP